MSVILAQSPPTRISWGPLSATMVADSLNPAGVRLSTLEVVLPRFLLAEANTHRMLSRNAESSRSKGADRIRKEPLFTPLMRAENKKMRADEILDTEDKARSAWEEAAKSAAAWSETLSALGVHHSIPNRLLEPFRTVRWLVSFTESANFLSLRFSPEAEPHFQAVAALIILALRQHSPVQAKFGDWHAPYLRPDEASALGITTAIHVSVARCARLTVGRELSVLTRGEVDKELGLYERLLENRHMSPFEHVAQAENDTNLVAGDGNFRGWYQWRKTIDEENLDGAFDPLSVSDQVLETIVPGWTEEKVQL